MANTLLIAKRIQLSKQRLDALLAHESITRAQAKELLKQRAALDREIMRLISVNIQTAGEEYDAATEALAKANTALADAIDDIDQIGEAINKVTAAVKWVSKVLEMA
jgi:uncharacterized protein YukE